MTTEHIYINQGEAHWAAKLTNERVLEARRLHYKVGLCIKCIAILFKENYQTIFDAVTYRTWRHLP